MPGPAITTVAEALCRTRLESFPYATADRAADCILDVIGAAVAGQAMPGSCAMTAAMVQNAPGGDSAVWSGTAPRLGAIHAATANAMCATALDVDDGHRRAAGHPGAAVVTAAIAVAENVDASISDLLVATVVGYEAAIRVALSRKPEYHTSTVSGRWSGVGAAAAAAWLRRLPPEQMAEAILIAEQHAPRAGSAMHHGFAGSDVKEAIAWSVHSGLYAVDLAQKGFRGYPDTFDQGVLYDASVLLDELGQFRAINGLFFKPYACCRWIHSAIDALAGLMAEHRLTPAAVSEVTVRTFVRAARLGNHMAPATEVQAQFSIPFCLGVTAVQGRAALLPLDPRLLQDRAVLDFARKVAIREDAELDRLFPAKAAATVEVVAGDLRISRHVDAAFGDPTNPMSRADLQAKFDLLVKRRLPMAARDEIVSSLADWPAKAGVPVREWTRHWLGD